MPIHRLFRSAYLAYHLYGQARLPFQPLEGIRRIQAQRVRAMISYAYQTVPYYRETMDRLCLTVNDFQNANDLSKLPLIEPDQVQRDPGYFTSTTYPLNKYFRLRTGGSTGDPRSVYHTASSIFRNAAHGERERFIFTSVIGKRFGYREMVIASPTCTAFKLQNFCQKHAFLPFHLQIQRQYISLLDPIEKNIHLINEFKPDIVQSYGSYLEILFSFLSDTQKPFRRPKVIAFSSDGLNDSVRHLIQERFQIPVFSIYQANEAFKIGFECESHMGLHLNIDLYPVRIVDLSGKEVAESETGEVVVSNLVNQATILLNYRLGDLAALLPLQCPCGRSLPLLSFPPGRSDDLIELPSGQILHPQAIRSVFAREERVWQYQFIQHSGTHFSLKVVAARGTNLKELKDRMMTNLAERLGMNAQVDISFVDSIDRTSGGKFRPVISMTRKSPPGQIENQRN
jgi:phenylacetate-CoA ligase